jgi:hypothetical protein
MLELNVTSANFERANTEQTEITEDTEMCNAVNVPSVQLFPFVPYSLSYLCIVFTCLFTVLADPAFAQQSQNPSPMVEHTRTHQRLKQATPAGRRVPLRVGTLFLPAALKTRPTVPLFIHFHGAPWIGELAASELKQTAVITAQLGSGSSVYAKPFLDPQAFAQMLSEAEAQANMKFGPITLTSWSAGYGAIREILRVPEHYARVSRVLLLDGLHASYVNGKPGPQESEIEADNLAIFLQFARDAVAGRKQFFLTHTEIFPGTFVSTTETADWLLRELKLTRRPVLKWGPMGSQQLSEVRAGKFQLAGFAGNTAPDHVDLLHALPNFLRNWK